jgi:integrase
LYASALLHEGVSIKEQAAFLGHADEALTLRTYVHLMPNSYTWAATAVDAIFAPGQPARSRRAGRWLMARGAGF